MFGKNNFSLLKKHGILFVVLAVSAIYSPSLFSEFCVIDDLEMLAGLRSVARLDLSDVFIPHATGGLYYRPIIVLSFLFDRFVLNLDPVLMHLHNVLIHIANVVLVFLITRHISPKSEEKYPFLPACIALLFGLHPITTESVNWISGRTDLLSGFFILCATLLLMKYRRDHSRLHAVFAILSTVLAVLTKEFALAFLPAAALILTVRTPDEEKNHVSRRRLYLFLLAMFVAIIALFFLLRSMAFSSNSSRLAMTVRILLEDYVHTIKVSMGAFAFYLKKIFIPWPINFAIQEIDPLYELLAIPFLVVCVRAARYFTMASAMFLSGIMLYAPALLIAFNQIAWTPYAERYAYLSSAFVIMAVCFYACTRWSTNRYIAGFFFLPIAVFAGTTLERNIVWQTNYALIADMAHKNPDDANVRYLYGAQLAEHGRYAEAIAEFNEGKKLYSLGYDERFDLALAEIYQELHQRQKAEEFLEEALRRSNGKSERVKKKYREFMDKKAVLSGNNREGRDLSQK